MAAPFKTDFQIPGSNRIALSDALADEIRERFNADRQNRFELFVLAAGLRKKYLNAKTREYAPEFQSWYRGEKMDELFGSLSNFTKYASAGDVVAYTANKTSDPEKYLKQLPVSVGALYEISQILGPRGRNKSTFILCMTQHPTRTSVDQSPDDWGNRRGRKVIHPRATEADIRNWRRNWENPPPPKMPRTDKRTLPMATIYVSGELFDFDTKKGTYGDKVGCVELPDVETFMEKLTALFGEDNALQFRLESNMDYLTEGYFKRKEQADPANRIDGKVVRPKPTAKKRK